MFCAFDAFILNDPITLYYNILFCLTSQLNIKLFAEIIIYNGYLQYIKYNIYTDIFIKSFCLMFVRKYSFEIIHIIIYYYFPY